MVKPWYGDLVDCPGQTMGRNYNLTLNVLRFGLFSRLNFEMLLASLTTLLSSLAHRMLHDMLILWPVISWLDQEMPIIVNCSWGPQSSCHLHRLSYIFACYPHISVIYFVCVTSSCLPKSFNLLTDVLSYVRVPTCPSFNPISSLCAFEPLHHISPLLSYLPILHSDITTSYYISPSLSHLPVWYHHFNSSHYTSPSLSHLPILQSNIITSIHCTISACHYPTCPSSNLIHHFDSSAHRYPTYQSFNPISSLRFIALYQPTALCSTYHGKSLLSGQSTVSM